MKLYRADKRNFIVGETIKSAGEFTSRNPEGSNLIEDLLESLRPSEKPERSKCLYLFEDLTVAKKHWSKMTDGKLYEVEVDEQSILHRADMQLVDSAFVSEDSKEKAEFANDYWLGKETGMPRIEVLVDQAEVVSVISKNQDERRAYFRSWALA